MAQPMANQPSSTAWKRRSRRFPFISRWKRPGRRLTVKFSVKRGRPRSERSGGLLEMKTYPAAGTQIELTNLVTHETSQARVVGVRRNSEGRFVRGCRRAFRPQ